MDIIYVYLLDFPLNHMQIKNSKTECGVLEWTVHETIATGREKTSITHLTSSLLDLLHTIDIVVDDHIYKL